ncbi:hypothetical protein M9Y10_026209 [Tritrichomonas musculus]|uniref:Protein kinase domain-containing protein n=1 Tax=Tritrichomonas musculus TaxID=1915356 RepID=A0ABR2H7U6_9EUKA
MTSQILKMIHYSRYKKKIDFSQFEIGNEPIGSGSFGKVYLVTNKEDKEKYAMKVLKCEKDNLEREIEILEYVNHPTIAKYLDHSYHDYKKHKNITILMEYAENNSLAFVIKNNPKKLDNTNRQIILVGIARGMKYLHDRNIIHRDLKPENILLNALLQPIISDFGLSKFFHVGDSKN